MYYVEVWIKTLLSLSLSLASTIHSILESRILAKSVHKTRATEVCTRDRHIYFYLNFRLLHLFFWCGVCVCVFNYRFIVFEEKQKKSFFRLWSSCQIACCNFSTFLFFLDVAATLLNPRELSFNFAIIRCFFCTNTKRMCVRARVCVCVCVYVIKNEENCSCPRAIFSDLLFFHSLVINDHAFTILMFRRKVALRHQIFCFSFMCKFNDTHFIFCSVRHSTNYVKKKNQSPYENMQPLFWQHSKCTKCPL